MTKNLLASNLRFCGFRRQLKPHFAIGQMLRLQIPSCAASRSSVGNGRNYAVSAAVQSAHGMVGATGIVPAVKRLLLKGPKAAASPGPSTKTRKIRLPFGKALQKQHHKIENMLDRLTD
jgi:hypothetical protein